MEQGFVLKGSICYSESPQALHALETGYVVCEGGLSQGAFAALPQQYRDLPVHDYGRSLILPGLTDLHVHAPQYAFRGLGMDLELLQWLDTLVFPQERRYEDLAYAAQAYGAFVQDLRKGPNTRACVFATAHVPATLLLMDMLEASGLVTMVGKVNMDRNGIPGLQEASAAQSLRDTERWILESQARFRQTTPILTPRFIPSCSDALLEGLGALQQKYGLPVQSHLSENLSELAWVKSLHPDAETYGAAYAKYGLFGGGVPTVMAHCVWSSAEEIALMRERGVYVAHCPQSNMNLSSGIAPVRRFLQEGLHVGLGSDVAGGCHTSILRGMSDAIQASKLRWRLVDDTLPALTVPEAFYLATVGGGSFFGRVGSFAPGYELDAVVIDDAPLAGPAPLSVADRLARAVYLSDDRHIRAKYVRGRPLAVEEGMRTS